MQEIRLQLSQPGSPRNAQPPRLASPWRFNDFSVSLRPKARVAPYRLSSIEMGQTSLAFVPLERQRFIQPGSSENVLTMPVIPVSVTTQTGPVITPTYVLSEGANEEFLSDEIDGVSILEVLIEKPLSSGETKTNEESSSKSPPPAPPTPATVDLPQPPPADEP